MAQKKKEIAEKAKENVNIKKEEAFGKRNVKTILDAEAAELERKKYAKEKQTCYLKFGPNKTAPNLLKYYFYHIGQPKDR